MTQDDFEPGTDALAAARHEIDALLDGEPVDKAMLRAALADVDAREYLVDALLLRRMTREMGPAHFIAPAKPRGVIGRQVRWLAAALVLTTSALSGYLYGQHSQPATSTSVEVALDAGSAPPPAPTPTRVIRFEPGVNWTNANGSH